MLYRHSIAPYAIAVLAIAEPASAAYVVEPLSVQGSFTPITITDSRYVAGTTVTGDGSLATITDGTDSRSYDFCGGQGAADGTTLTATSPYSVNRYLAGNCGNASAFVFDVARNVLTALTAQSPSGTRVDAVGPGGLVAGDMDEHSGGNVAFYYRNGRYTTFFPGEFSTVTRITGNGTIVGYWQNLGGVGAGFTVKPGGTPVNVPPPQTTYGHFVFLDGGNRRDQFAAVVVDPEKARAALWQAGRYTYPRLPADTVGSGAYAINENGDVAGMFVDPAGTNHVFVWHTATDEVDVVAFPPQTEAVSVASINNRGDFTGTYTRAGSKQAYRAIWRP